MDTGEVLAADVGSLRMRPAASCDRPFDSTPGDASANAARLGLIAALEDFKNTACAVQACLAVAVDIAVRAEHAAQGLPKAQHGRGVAAQVALARRESPHRGQQLVGLAKDLHTELPSTLKAMLLGALSEYRASVVARESGCLDSERRRALDSELFGVEHGGTEAEALGWGTRQLAGEVARQVCAADPAAVARRRARAESERNVSVRPAPEQMTYLTAMLPLAQGIAAYASLTARAKGARAAGDERGKGQLMADLLVADVTGGSASDGPPAVPVTVDVVISDRALGGATVEPALLLADGVPATPIDAISARALIADAIDPQTAGTETDDVRADDSRVIDSEADHRALDATSVGVWLRRLYVDPGGHLVAMSSRTRFARGGLAEFLRIRDHGLCRTPWCDAPIVEYDHVTPAADGGPTAATNLQGLCAACNHAKQAPGWTQHAHTQPGGGHVVDTVTPTGTRLRSVTRPMARRRRRMVVPPVVTPGAVAG
jgi:hypothetical protein